MTEPREHATGAMAARWPTLSPDSLAGAELLRVPVWVYVFDENRIVWANEESLALWRADSLAELSARSYTPESAATRDRLAWYRNRFDAGQSLEEPWTFYPKGEPVAARVRLNGCRWMGDRPAMLVEVAVQEIGTEVEEARRADGLLHAPMATLLIDGDGTVLLSNPAADLLFERLGRGGDWSARLGDPGRAAALLAEGLAREETGPVDLELNDRDGRLLCLSLTTRRARDPGTGRPALYAFFIDVTDREVARRSLESQATFIETVLDTSPNLVFVKNRAGAFTYVNRAVETLFDKPKALLIGTSNKAVHDNTDEVDHFDEVDRRVIDGGETVSVEESFTLKNGERRIYRTIKAPLARADGSVEALGIALDVTDFRAQERALLEAKRTVERASAAKSQFLATMSHEIRTPMNGVIGMAQVLRETSLSADQREMLEIILSSAEALLILINDILDFSKIEAGHLTLETGPVDPVAIVESVIDLLSPKAGTKGLDCALVVDPTVPRRLLLDAGRVRQILVNLIGNAIKFTAEGGVTIMVSLTGQAPDRSLEVSVQDTGIGIGAEDHERLFEPFAQADQSNARRFGGTGLGLTISRRLAEAMGGRITLTSTPGVGSVFTMVLPATLPEREEAAETTAALPPDIRMFAVGFPDALAKSLVLQMLLWGLEARAVDRLQDLRLGGEPRPLAFLVPADAIDAAFLAAAAPLNATLIAIAERGRPPVPEAAITLTKPVRSSDLFDALASLMGPGLAARPARLVVKEEKAPSVGALTVLVAEDNPVNQQVIDRMLRNDGHRVELVSTGVDALAALERRAFDVVLMDIQMPEMDGLEATRVLRRRDGEQARVPVIAMTANVLPGAVEECLAAGMDNYLPKPVDRRALAVALAQLVAPEPTGLPPTFLARTARPESDRPHATGPEAASPLKTDPTSGLPDEDGLAVDTDRLTLLAQDFESEEIVSLIDAFAAEAARRVPEIVAGDAAPDTVRRAAHTLKSAAGNIGLVRVADLAERLEAIARTGHPVAPDMATSFAATIERDLQTLRAAIDASA